MLKRLLLSGAAFAALASVAVAQNAAPSSEPAAQHPPVASDNNMTTNSGGNTNSGGMAATPPASADQQARNSEDPNLFSNIKGADVVGQNDESVGSVADLLLDASGTLQGLVVAHGGIIGIGQTYRRHDISALPTVTDGKVSIGNVDTAALEGMPEYKYPEAAAGRASTTDTTNAPADGNAASTPAPAPADASANASAAGDTSAWPVSELIGADIKSGDQTAAIKDIRFEGNKAAAAVVDKGALGMAAEATEVAWNDLAIAGTPAEPEITLASGGGAGAPASGAGMSAPNSMAPNSMAPGSTGSMAPAETAK